MEDLQHTICHESLNDPGWTCECDCEQCYNDTDETCICQDCKHDYDQECKHDDGGNAK